MDFKQIQNRALEIRNKYTELVTKKYGKAWTKEQRVQGFVGDVGDLVKLAMAKEGVREIENVDEKFAHELADCLWAVLVIADEYGVDIEKSFTKTMNELESKIEKEISQQ